MNTHLPLKNKQALVTGAGSGIGKATALLLASLGAKVAILGRSKPELETVLHQLGGAEQGHLLLVADVSQESELQAALESLRESWDHLDILVPNAGVNGAWAPLGELTVAEWEHTLSINLTGTFLTVKSALPLLEVRGGSIVIVASINGTRIFSNSGATAYAVSKAGQVALTKMIALELARLKIRVNVVCPGAVETNINDSMEQRNLAGLHLPVHFPKGDVPLNDGRSGSAHHVAEAIAFLASDAAAHITGTEIYVDGAQSLLQG